MKLTFLLVTIFSTLLSTTLCAKKKPNVIIIYSDDHGTLDAKCFGAKDLHTPNIDQLADQGIRFTQAYSHTFCCPSRAALLTGRHPQRGGVNHWTQGDMKAPVKEVNMSLDEITLAEVMKDAGYKTALFGKWHLGAHKDYGPTRQGFETFFGIRGGFIDNYNHFFLQDHGYHDLYEGTTEIWKKGEYFPKLMIERTLSFISENKDAPFFLYLPFNAPHYPEQALPEDLLRYKHIPQPRRSYAAFLTTMDRYIGQVLERLDVCKLREDTIIIFMGDNGHQSYQNYKLFQIKYDDHASGFPKGYRFSSGDGPNDGGGFTGKWIGNKGTFLEGGVRVPAILSYPGRISRGIVRDQIVSTMDWFPTVLELCDVKIPEAIKLDGHSLVKLMESPEAKSPHPILHFQWQNKWSVRDGDWKLIFIKANRDSYNGHYFLYNLADEEPERKNYLEEKPRLVERLKKLHEEWEKDVFAGQTERPWVKPEL